MSYEGYEEHICKNGHRFLSFDIYSYGDPTPLCDTCKAPSVFYNPVDTTNGPPQGEFSEEGWAALQLTEQVFEKCNLGHAHCVQEATYRVPNKKEAKQFRQYHKED